MSACVETTDLAVTPFGVPSCCGRPLEPWHLHGRRERLGAGVQRKLRNGQPMCRADMAKLERASMKHFGSKPMECPPNTDQRRSRSIRNAFP